MELLALGLLCGTPGWAALAAGALRRPPRGKTKTVLLVGRRPALPVAAAISAQTPLVLLVVQALLLAPLGALSAELGVLLFLGLGLALIVGFLLLVRLALGLVPHLVARRRVILDDEGLRVFTGAHVERRLQWSRPYTQWLRSATEVTMYRGSVTRRSAIVFHGFAQDGSEPFWLEVPAEPGDDTLPLGAPPEGPRYRIDHPESVAAYHRDARIAGLRACWRDAAAA